MTIRMLIALLLKTSDEHTTPPVLFLYYPLSSAVEESVQKWQLLQLKYQ